MRPGTALIPSLFFALALPSAAKASIIGTYEITGSHSLQGPCTGDVRVEDGSEGLDLVVHAGERQRELVVGVAHVREVRVVARHLLRLDVDVDLTLGLLRGVGHDAA